MINWLNVEADERRTGFNLVVPPNGYVWWYVDALSDDGENGLTIIAFIDSVFSPYYAFARRRGSTDPLKVVTSYPICSSIGSASPTCCVKRLNSVITRPVASENQGAESSASKAEKRTATSGLLASNLARTSRCCRCGFVGCHRHKPRPYMQSPPKLQRIPAYQPRHGVKL
jgi:hypothetical protein